MTKLCLILSLVSNTAYAITAIIGGHLGPLAGFFIFTNTLVIAWASRCVGEGVA